MAVNSCQIDATVANPCAADTPENRPSACPSFFDDRGVQMPIRFPTGMRQVDSGEIVLLGFDRNGQYAEFSSDITRCGAGCHGDGAALSAFDDLSAAAGVPARMETGLAAPFAFSACSDYTQLQQQLECNGLTV